MALPSSALRARRATPDRSMAVTKPFRHPRYGYGRPFLRNYGYGQTAAQFYGYGHEPVVIFMATISRNHAVFTFSPNAIAAPETPDLGHFRFSRLFRALAALIALRQSTHMRPCS